MIVFNDPTIENPGPGAYNQQALCANSKSSLSKFKSPTGPRLVAGEKRFDYTDIRRASLLPGPGQYTPRIEGGHGPSRVCFSKEPRLVTLDTSETRRITPGPGTYKSPSEFGYYDMSGGSTPKLSLSRSSSTLLLKAPKQKLNVSINKSAVAMKMQSVQ